MAEFDALWDYDRPEATEAKFRALLPAAERAGDRSYHAQLLSQIARAEGLQGRFEPALVTLDAAERLLTDGLVVARVRCLLERGRVYNSWRQPDRALPLFQAAWEVARAAGEDDFAVDAAHMLAIAEPLAAQKLAWNHRALALAEGSPEARRWLGSLYNNIGWTYADGRQYEQALAMFERAVAFREEQGDAAALRIARWCVAKTLRLLGREAEALAVQEQLLTQAGGSKSEGGFIYEELAECLLALGRSEEARSYFALAHRLLSQQRWLREGEPERLERLRALGGG